MTTNLLAYSAISLLFALLILRVGSRTGDESSAGAMRIWGVVLLGVAAGLLVGHFLTAG